MKKIRRKIIGILVLLVMMFSLTACGSDLDGTYISNDAARQKFVFDGDKITMSAFGLNCDGTYEISNGQLIVTYNFPFLGEQVWRTTFSKDGSNLIIGGTEFIKQ